MLKNSAKIVLVGAGSGGFLLYKEMAAKLLDTDIQLIVIEPRKFYLHLPGSLRIVVTPEGGLEDRFLMDHPENLGSGNTRFVYAKVTSIVDNHNDGGHVTLDNGETIDFSILILSTGSSWSGPIAFGNEKDEILQSVNSWHARFREAEDIVLVGGGAVGLGDLISHRSFVESYLSTYTTELSGEIKDTWSDKRVTIIHNRALPLNDSYPQRWRNEIARKIRKRGTNLVLGDSLESFEPKNGTIITRQGKVIPADLVVPTFGGRPNTSFIKSLGSDVLSPTGHVKLRRTLQLESHPRIFALGDIIDWKEEKQGVKAFSHVPIVLENVMTLINDRPQFELKEYKGSYEIIALINGKNGGTTYIGILWGIILGDWFTSWISAKTLGVIKTRMGL